MVPDAFAKCYGAHMGLWAVHVLWFDRMLASLQQGLLTPMAAVDQAAQRQAQRDGYVLRGDGTAVIPLHGHLTKGGDSFGAGSTVLARQQMRMAARSRDVERTMLHISSPGGHFAGTEAVARDVRELGRIKPIDAHIEDEGASAAYYIASQARTVTAEPDALVGSIGVALLVDDTTGAMDRLGVTRHLLSTGPYKGAGYPGVEVTEPHLKHFQALVDQSFTFFRQAVMQGRGLSSQAFDAVADGRVFFAEEARSLGLVDRVVSFDESLNIAAHNGGSARMKTTSALLEEIRQTAITLEELQAEGASTEGIEQLADNQDLSQLLAVVYQAGRAQAQSQPPAPDATAALAEQFEAGRVAGRKEAAEIAALYQVAEMPTEIAPVLAATENGEYVTVEVARRALNIARVQVDESETIVSHLAPAGTSKKESKAHVVIDHAEIFAFRRAQLKG